MSMTLYTNGMGGGGSYYSYPASDSPESPIVSETPQQPAGVESTAIPLTKQENDEAAKRLKEAAENMGTYFRLERELKESKEAVKASKEAVKAAEDATEASRKEVDLHKSNADAATKRAEERQAKLDEIARKKAEALQKLELLKAQRDAAAANVSK